MVTISKFSYENPRYVNLLKRRSSIPEEVETTVKNVLKDVKRKGDEALYSYMKKFDNVDINEIGLFVSEEEFAHAREKVSEEFKESVKKAAAVAYGTETVKKVDAIAGPGNNFTQMAKKADMMSQAERCRICR